MKTTELKEAALDWAVAKSEGLLAFGYETDGERLWITLSTGETELFSPHINWAQGGPIIERERIEIVAVELGEEWIARDYWKEFDEQSGPTPLVAAMRCYVASKLGEEVEIPAELMEAA